MGVPGPGGPCSEIYYDRGPEYGREGGPVADEDRYLEVWNLVFMQYARGAGPGKEGYPISGELPSKNIDTGMGLERMAAMLQGVDNIYEIDTMWKVLDRAAELTEQKYGRDHRTDVSLRIVADHMRTAVMLVVRRRAAVQRGPRLRAAADPAAQPSATCGCSSGAQRGGTGGSHAAAAAAMASASCTSSPRHRHRRARRAVPGTAPGRPAHPWP